MMTKKQASEMDGYYRRSRRPLFRNPTTVKGKIGCGLLLVIWFSLLMLPFLMFWLASGRSVTIPHSNIPNANQYPRFEMSLIMSQENRGLQLTTSDVQRNSSDNLRVEVHVNYLLWVSEADDNAAVYCDRFERNNSDADWMFIESLNTPCNP
ncbi:MAG: hypothetical protein Q9P01_09725 [Anaerolineae bacterium]|nr:hypothetical protein [Anaerolineae bacterium]MDQ7035094.1 hypothetical protein [Anaerolineae bacterium]